MPQNFWRFVVGLFHEDHNSPLFHAEMYSSPFASEDDAQNVADILYLKGAETVLGFDQDTLKELPADDGIRIRAEQVMRQPFIPGTREITAHGQLLN